MPYNQDQKAFAFLDRGPEYPTINAMSGSTQPGWSNVLDNAEWTDMALKLCNDGGHGTTRGFASHVEKQLAAYYFECHCIGNFDEGDIDPKELEDIRAMMPPESRARLSF